MAQIKAMKFTYNGRGYRQTVMLERGPNDVVGVYNTYLFKDGEVTHELGKLNWGDNERPGHLELPIPFEVKMEVDLNIPKAVFRKYDTKYEGIWNGRLYIPEDMLTFHEIKRVPDLSDRRKTRDKITYLCEKYDITWTEDGPVYITKENERCIALDAIRSKYDLWNRTYDKKEDRQIILKAIEEMNREGL